MKPNLRQEELIEELVTAIKGKYPEISLVEVKESPENPDTLWICITAPADEDREIGLSLSRRIKLRIFSVITVITCW